MESIDYRDNIYRTPAARPSFVARLFPSFRFYASILRIVFTGSRLAKQGRYDDDAWARSSIDSLRGLERVGVTVEVTGIENVRNLGGPCVFIANHMSTLETFVLPVLIVQHRPVTFVVKQSLVEYPVFRHIMRSRDPITVGRTNPRDDLKAVLEGGAERLRKGTSIVIFPQTTRQETFDPSQFNTIGVKLAKRADVPVVPVALLTNAWGNGRVLKDFGKIDRTKPVHFAFGEPMRVAGRGDEEHRKVIEFISAKLSAWGGTVADTK